MNNPLNERSAVSSSPPIPWPASALPKHGPQAIRILHLEDNDLDAALVRKLVTAEWPACHITLVSTRFAYTGELQLRQFDLILADYTLESFNGLEALGIAQQRTPETPFILLSGTVSEERAIEAIRAGARDYVLKDQLQRLTTAIHRALKENEERDRRQHAERYSRELAGFLNKAHDAIIVINPDNQITFWNRGAEQLTGWGAVEVANQTTERLFGADVAAQIARGLKITSEQGEWTGELELCTKAGQARLVEFRISLITDERGRAQARLAICTDLTQQKLAERRIREQAEMLDQAREAIVITNLEGSVIYWSAGAERIYGWQSDEAVGQLVETLFPDAAVLGRLRHAREITRAQGEWHGQMHLNDRLGKPRVVDMRRTLIRDESGRGKAHLSISSDVTEQKRLEEQLARAQRLENIGLLAAGIAHDLNNMLAPMLIAVPMLRQAVTDPAALRTLDILEQSAERGAALIRQILSFAQSTGGGAQLVELRHLLRDIGRDSWRKPFRRTLRRRNGSPPTCGRSRANLTQLHQVLLESLPQRPRCHGRRVASLSVPTPKTACSTQPGGGRNRRRPRGVVCHPANRRHGRRQMHLGAGPSVGTVCHDQRCGQRARALGARHRAGDCPSARGLCAARHRPGASGTSFRIFLPAVDAQEPATAALCPPRRRAVMASLSSPWMTSSRSAT